jgi:transcription elongation factor Elf1
MQPHRQPKRTKPRVPRWTAHVEAKARAAAEAAEKRSRPAPYDDGFRGELPAGAIRADIRRQCSRSWTPDRKYYYLDKVFDCQICGKTEVWTARQQQWWYEVARGEIETTATTCRSCRKRKQRTSREATRNAWLAKFGRLKKLAPQLAGIPWEYGPDGSSTLQRPLAALALEARSVETLHKLGILTTGEFLSKDFREPVPGVTLHYLDTLGSRLKALLPANTKRAR